MKTVLVIEDSTNIRENACEMLELEGYKVISARNGKDGIESARQNKPDIILCDIWMPEADGYEAFNTLRNDSVTAQIPFIFLTASVEKKEVEAAISMGANGYITKPFKEEEFFGTIERCLTSIPR